MDTYPLSGDWMSLFPDTASPAPCRILRRVRGPAGDGRPREGFTLIEIMIVIVIIGILATIAINLTFKMTGKADEAAVKSDLSQAYKAAQVYHGDYPEGNVTVEILRKHGYRASEKVTLTVVNGSMDGLRMTATHPGIQGKTYVVDHNGGISEE